MDVRASPIYEHVADLLPQSVHLSEGNAAAGLQGLYVRSLRFLSSHSTFLVRAFLISTKRCVTFVVKDLSFYLMVAARHRQRVRFTKFKRTFRALLHNADRKTDEWFDVYVFAHIDEQFEASKYCNGLLRGVDTTYCFGDLQHNRSYTHDGNTVMVSNNFLCSHLYYYRPREGSDDEFPGVVSLSELMFDEERHAALLMDLGGVLPYAYREGAFDIETVYDESFYSPALRCDAFDAWYFADYRGLFARYERLSTRTTVLEKPPTEAVVMKLHQIMSVSLVVCRYDVPKTAEAPHRKELCVFYDASLSSSPPDFAAYADTARQLGIEPERVRATGCANEFELLRAFLGTLVRRVDTLYVYHANFDVSIVEQRIAYYAFAGRTEGCCATHAEIERERGSELRQLWRHFLSKAPDLYEGRLHLGLQLAQQHYKTYLNKVERVLSGERGSRFGQPESAERVKGATRVPLSLAKSEYLDKKGKLQNLKSNCFGSEVIDLMLVCRQPRFEQCNSGKLDQKAHLIVSTLGKRGKNPLKMRKLADVSYDQLDEAYRAGGVRLAECLLYNLIDSQLLVRIARCIQPLQEYVFRQVSTYNADQIVHNRGVMHFAGFIASVKSVELSKFKARLDAGRVHSTGDLKNHLYEPETIARRGGFVLQPLTGLSFSFPRRPFELIVDFASMYPGIMCDLNISSESIVDHGRVDRVCDYLAYDWSRVPMGFDKYTLLARVERDPATGAPTGMTKYKSDVYGSLKRYLELRAFHKTKLKTCAPGSLEHDYHQRLQNEMKVCANSHYGVADVACSLMITTQGQHRIKVVNESLKRVHSIPNYGDTDSTMFWSRADPDETSYETYSSADEGEREDLDALLRELTAYVAARFRSTQRFVLDFLRTVATDLIDDTFEKTLLVTRDAAGQTLKTPARRCETTGDWLVTDPRSGVALNISETLSADTITKLEYESCSSVTCHVAKKMYICLLHDIAEADGALLKTSLKRRGMTGFKTSRFGPTETVMEDFVSGVFQGDALVTTASARRYEWRPWPRVTEGDRVTLLRDGELRCVRVTSVRRATLGSFTCVRVQTDAGFGRWVLCQKQTNVTHLVSSDDHVLREKAFVEVCYHRTYSISRGLIPWHQLIRYAKPAAIKAEFFDKRGKYGLLLGKELKVPYVTVVDKKTYLRTIYNTDQMKQLQYPREWPKQDPAYAFFRHYPIDLKLDVMLRDYFGTAFACESPAFERQPAFAASALKRRLKTRPLVDQLEIKSRIDSLYLNASSKCLVHVLMDLHGPREAGLPASEPERIEACVTEVVNAVLRCKARIEELMKKGKTVFYSIKCNIPPEMKNAACGLEAYAYDAQSDEASKPLLGSHVRDCESRDDAECMYAESLERLRQHLHRCRDKTLLRVTGLAETAEEEGEPCSNKTLTVLSPRIARDLGLERTPHLVLISNGTEDEDLAETARWLYTALLARHCVDGDDFEFAPPQAVTRLGPPPLYGFKRDLALFFAQLQAYLERTPAHAVKAHCNECYQFWRRQHATDVIVKNYYFNGKFFVFHRKRLACPLLSS